MTQSLSAWTVSVGGVAAVDLGVAVTAVAVGDFVAHGMWPHSTNFPFKNMQLMKIWQQIAQNMRLMRLKIPFSWL